MSTYARALLIPTGMDCVVHAVIRCVRRAWLCGVDPYTGKDFEHRRDWMRERRQHLPEVFAIEKYGWNRCAGTADCFTGLPAN